MKTITKLSSYNLVERTSEGIIVDEDKLDLFDYYTKKIPDWQPPQKPFSLDEVSKCYLDIETTGLNPLINEVISIGFKYINESKDRNEYHIFKNDGSERNLLIYFLKSMKRNTPKILVGHNIFNFDIPFLVARLDKHGLPHNFTKGEKPTTVTGSSLNGRPITITQYYYPNVDIIDTFILAGIYDKSANTLPSLGLKDLGIHFEVREERRLELSYQEILDCWDKKDHETIETYLRFDLDDTHGLFNKLFPVFWYQSFLIGKISLQYICLSSTAFKWQKIAESFGYNTFNLVADEKIKYQGAITGVNPGLYRDCYKIDVSSMYPSIMLTYGLYSRKDKEGKLLGALLYLVRERLQYKALYKKTKDENYNIRQNALKILINSLYGFHGVGGYSFNCMPTATLVTAYGRAIVKLMCAVLKDLSVDIVEIDTDGIICNGGDPNLVLKTVQSRLPRGITIDLDWSTTHVYVPKTKSYLLWKPDGKIKKVGIFKKRNKSQLELKFPIKICDLILNYSRDDANNYYRQVLEDLKNRVVAVSELEVTRRIPVYKVPTKNRLVEAKLGNYGDKVTYYEAELIRYHKTSGKQIKSHPTPTQSDPYWIEFYIKLIKKLYTEIINVVDRKIEGNIDEQLGTMSNYYQMFR